MDAIAAVSGLLFVSILLGKGEPGCAGCFFILGIPAAVLCLVFFLVFRNLLNKLEPAIKEWRYRVQCYQKGIICHRCGHSWFPGE